MTLTRSQQIQKELHDKKMAIISKLEIDTLIRETTRADAQADSILSAVYNCLRIVNKSDVLHYKVNRELQDDLRILADLVGSLSNHLTQSSWKAA